MEKRVRQILNFIEENDHFLLTAHMNADGDAYASVLAMAYFLNRLGKEYQIVFHDQRIDQKYRFLWGFDQIQSYRPDMEGGYRAAIVLDVPSRKRIGDPAKLLPDPAHCLKIDHHPLEDNFAQLHLVDTGASSTSRLVYEVVTRSAIPMDENMARCLFSGIMYDTGRFSFSNTSRRDFEVAAELLKFPVKPYEIANHIFFNNSFESMKVIGYGLANMESLLDGKLAIIHLPLEVMKRNNHSEIEELANYSVAIHGVEVGLFVREIEPNFYKVSFRSRGRVNVNAIARLFDGGGHLHAAGCRFRGSYPEFRQKVADEIKKALEKLDGRSDHG